ncbi:MAG: hypothetical protein HXX13_02160 [Bacteroidetes bacterium]|nr:hypothetical protein [Bacteroidota bacterium]
MQKEMLEEYRSEQRKEKIELLKKRAAHPFTAKETTPDQEYRSSVRKEIRQMRRESQKKWILEFKKNPVKTLFGKSRDESKLLTEQLRKADKKIAYQNKVNLFQNGFVEAVKTKQLRGRLAITFFQSTAIFLISFLFLYVIYQAATILTSYLFNIPTIWYYYRIKFPLFSGSPLYTRIALIFIFASGPVVSLATGFIFLRMFFRTRPNFQNLRLFYLWGFIAGLNFFFGSYLVGFITRTEFIYTTEWLFMSSMFDVEEIIFAVISIAISLIVGRLVTPLFLITSGSEKIIEPKYRFFFILNQIYFPWATGVVIFYLIMTPVHYLPLTLKLITPIFILLPSLFTFNSSRNETIHITGVARKGYFRWSIVILVIAILFFYRVFLSLGLKFF